MPAARLMLIALLLVAGCTSGAAVHRPPPSATDQPKASASRAAAQRTHRDGRPDCFRGVSASRVGARTVYLIAGNCTSWQVFRSFDGGRSWTRLRTLRPDDQAEASLVAFADRRRGWVLSRRIGRQPSRVLATSDGGLHWRRLAIADATDVAAVGGYGYLLAGGRLLISTPGTTRFVVTERTDADALFVSNGAVLVYRNVPKLDAAPPTFQMFRNAVRTQARFPCRRYTYGESVAALSADRLVAVCASEAGAGEEPKRAFSSTDGGRSWHRLGVPPLTGYLSEAAASGSRAFFTGGRSPLLQAKARGPWRVAVPGSGDAGGMWGLEFIDPAHGLSVDGGPPSALYLTDDGGATWRRAARP